MANQFVTTQEVARTALPMLKDALLFPRLIHNDYSEAYAAKQGDTVRIRKPVIYEAREFDTDNGILSQDIKEDCVNVTLNKIATVDVSLSAFDSALSFDDVNRLFIRPAALALAEKINADGLAMYRYVNQYVGTAGETPSSLGNLAFCRGELNRLRAPADNRCAVWDTEADTKFSEIPALVNAEKSGDTTALREGEIGRVFGINHYTSNAVQQHKTGVTAFEGVYVNGNVTGATRITLKGTSLVGKLRAGDLLTVGGKTYSVTQDTQTASSNTVTVNITPAMENVSSGTQVTMVGNHTPNLVFHPSAFAFVTRPLSAPAGVESYVTSFEGLSLRVVRGYDMILKREMLSMDVLYAYACVYPELAFRFLG